MSTEAVTIGGKTTASKLRKVAEEARTVYVESFHRNDLDAIRRAACEAISELQRFVDRIDGQQRRG